MEKHKIIMTGGGSAGHVTPNLALIPKLKMLGYEIEYIGTKEGIERKIIEGENIKYFPISSGKLRRYFDFKNFTDPLKVIKGIFEAKKIIKMQKPDIVFSKGGFVSVPVVLAAFFNKVPVIAHECDITPGLANRLVSPYCTKVCVTFPEALKELKNGKGVVTGNPIRHELFEGDKIKGNQICGFKDKKPVLMIIGGSLGSKVINDIIRAKLDKLLLEYNVIHICGSGNIDKSLQNKDGYKQFDYIKDELPHLLASADIVVSRAGANVIFELLALRKPNLLIPLSAKASRGDQILNARSFEKSGYSMVIQDEDLTPENVEMKIKELYNDKNKYIENMNNSNTEKSIDLIVELIEKYRKR
ncbi:undecaprenyldiphospho-muramoylpentapeptide beta-N-acetylglucosaminyltransferase [Clostridium estertheticum]|uniref:undecaprenyldiphospho-muramoylpentapeptide beta-N-acetylglucosaminyltransferase n=1 Tax=Clostridium estertheticum TaxID=238834 RepID=UPI001CF1AF42|nr:undecaprenyldiphospho-muramoylpentapeptide beta-N-acetylglucosaminyltransferase [Clostridium estertheticum]MCB2309470.1 undecaprenyldiphospho-muramoylpentapeptide beta-N-acetylglucosaminyltransferase [Clostridium estertheticum]MCB2347378.1 undecaprenyldiphospho-muramoylpentapeptide beta-N-acetylglucosaminyltransferase [Clostridium estertheticum]MCB2352423.1 undecaprenyldiphospho-muramoylpentapeptide beta-N-acetylglucosaminyltransferase [Clostridium estertheticum]WAG44469.1 undecaprenyldiphos